MKYYLLALKRITDFNGRSNRSEYWYFVLFNIIFSFVMLFIDSSLGLTFENSPYGLVYVCYAIAMLLPGLAVAVRRLHDSDKSGWWLLVMFIPVIGVVSLIVLLCKKSTEGTNKFGMNPEFVSFDFEAGQA